MSVYILDKHNISDELLYGRVGYLSALLYIQENISPFCIETDFIKKVFFSNALLFYFNIFALFLNISLLKKTIYLTDL